MFWIVTYMVEFGYFSSNWYFHTSKFLETPLIGPNTIEIQLKKADK